MSYCSSFLSVGLMPVAMLAAFAGAGPAQADDFLDITSLTPGAAGIGSFSGMLGGVTVSGSISALGGPPVFAFNPVGPGLGDSTTDGSSPQFSHASVFSPTAPSTDRVGFTYLSGAGNLVTLTFSAPVTNPVFHVANLDWVAFTFLPTPGFTSLTLLAGNHGPDMDGIDPAFGGAPYSSALVYDHLPPTTDSTAPALAPPTTGLRSAYGSVRINGSFSTLAFVTDAMGPFTDTGSFTLSLATPISEPGTVVLLTAGLLAIVGQVGRQIRH